MEVALPKPVDYIVGELMSIYCGNEYQVQIFKHLRQYLKPEGKLLPEYIMNIIQLTYADFDLKHKHYPINFTRHLAEQLSLQQIVNVIDLYQIENEIVDKTVQVKQNKPVKLHIQFKYGTSLDEAKFWIKE